MPRKTRKQPDTLPPTTPETRLHGMKAICNHTGYSPATILKWIREADFPATKISHEWISDKAKINAWWEARF